METTGWKLQTGSDVCHPQTVKTHRKQMYIQSVHRYTSMHAKDTHTHTHRDHWFLLVQGVICCYHCNWSNRGLFPARNELNYEGSLLLAASPSTAQLSSEEDQIACAPFPQSPLPRSLNFSSELIPQLILPSEATGPCDHFKRTQILINRPWAGTKPQQELAENPNKQCTDEWAGPS